MPPQRNAIRRRSSGGAKARYLWTTALFTRVLIPTTASDSLIVQPVDWERGSSSFERATLVRVRGWYQTLPEATTKAAWFGNVALYDEDEASSLPDVVGTYDSEDVLYTTGGCQNGTVAEAPGARIDVDIKVSRKLTSAMELRFVRTADVANIFSITGVLRACIRYS